MSIDQDNPSTVGDESALEPQSTSELSLAPSDNLQAKEIFLLKIVGVALGLFICGVLLGILYTKSTLENPNLDDGIQLTLAVSSYTILPILVVLSIIALGARSRHTQRTIFWITVLIFTILGCIVAQSIHDLSSPNVE